MKKSTLALSVAAALLGFAGNAMAIGTLTQAGTTAAVIERNPDGLGHQLVVPYFSTQAGNVTLLNITNTDKINGKLVKVRFRGGANSDDIFDFTLALSPADVWTAAVSQDPATGVSTLRTTDTSCVIPAAVKASTGALFLTDRVDPNPASGTVANQTREGYIEIIQMADIPVPTVTIGGINNSGGAKAFAAMTAAEAAATLYGQIKHPANGAPSCNDTALNALIGTDTSTIAGAGNTAAGKGLDYTSGGLTADWVILNQTSTASWSGTAAAFEARIAAGGASALGNIVFWPQKNGTPLKNTTPTELGQNDWTADPIFASSVVAIQNFDLPDLSTPYTTTDNTFAIAGNGGGAVGAVGAAQKRADFLSAQIAVKSITNSFVTNSGIAGATDFVFAQPTRRYSVGVNYKASTGSVGNNVANTTGAVASAVFRDTTREIWNTTPATTIGSAYFTTTNEVLTSRQVCLNSLGTTEVFDREENQANSSTGFVISPGPSAAQFQLCGEIAVLSFNSGGTSAGSALNASVVRKDITNATGFDLGWARFDTTNGGNALPIIGYSASRVANGAVNYGFTAGHKVTR